MITSTKNPRIQRIRRLQSKPRERQAEQVIIVEGVRLLEEALASSWVFRQTFYAEPLNDRGMQLVRNIQSVGAQVDKVSPGVIRAISGTETPQGIVAVLEMRPIPIPTHLDFLLILDQIRDPGNLGTILRTAAAANTQAVYLTEGTVDAFSSKVLRAGMGAHFRLPIHTSSWRGIRSAIERAGLRLFLSTCSGGNLYYDSDFKLPLALIIGGEADGAGQDAHQIADFHVHIPMPGGSESLNAAVAAGILLFEVARQREKIQ